MPLTPAQAALREAARRLASREAGGAAPAEPERQAPAPEAEPVASPARLRRRRRSRLLERDELYVGRPGLGDPFAYRDVDGDVLARVDVLQVEKGARLDAVLAGEGGDHADERWLVVDDRHDEPLFFVERYRPADRPSYGVFTPEGVHLATFLAEGSHLHKNFVVREAASAPVAAIRVRRHRHVIVEADGTEVGWCWRAFSAFAGDDDDEVWGLRLEQPAELLDRRALVAAPLVCHLAAFPKRRVDRGGEIAVFLVTAVPPVGLAVGAIERAVDGMLWLRRRLD